MVVTMPNDTFEVLPSNPYSTNLTCRIVLTIHSLLNKISSSERPKAEEARGPPLKAPDKILKKIHQMALLNLAIKLRNKVLEGIHDLQSSTYNLVRLIIYLLDQC